MSHPSHLDQWVGSGVGVGFGACAGVSYVVSSCVVDDVDDACMDGSALDGIRVGSNSVIQSFSEYHDSSCARLNALQNSHLERGHQVRGETKRSSTGSLCRVRLSAGKNFFPQQQSRKVHGDMWASLLKKQGPRISWEVEIIPGCAAMVACPSCHDNYLEPTGPGRWVGHSWRKQLGMVYGCSVVPSKVRVFFLPLSQQETGSGRGRTTQRGRSLFVLRVLVRTRTGKAPPSGPILESSVGHC